MLQLCAEHFAVIFFLIVPGRGFGALGGIPCLWHGRLPWGPHSGSPANWPDRRGHLPPPPASFCGFGPIFTSQPSQHFVSRVLVSGVREPAGGGSLRILFHFGEMSSRCPHGSQSPSLKHKVCFSLAFHFQCFVSHSCCV